MINLVLYIKIEQTYFGPQIYLIATQDWGQDSFARRIDFDPAYEIFVTPSLCGFNI
jgi:hypothetical protein